MALNDGLCVLIFHLIVLMFIESRNRHFSVNSFKELFEKVPPAFYPIYMRLVCFTDYKIF